MMLKEKKKSEKQTPNEADVHLLRENPNQLVEKYRGTIEIIVKKFIRKGMFTAQQFEDTVQEICLKLLDGRMKNVQKNYNGTALFSTFFSQVIFRLCLEIKRRDKKEKMEDVSQMNLVGSNSQALTKLTLQDEVRRLSIVLKMFHRSREKLEICLRLLYRISIGKDSFLAYCPFSPASDIEIILDHFGNGGHSFKDKEIYQKVIPVFNRCDQKKNTPDALRKWVNSKIEEIVALMNGNPPRANYDKKVLGGLIEKYYQAY